LAFVLFVFVVVVVFFLFFLWFKVFWWSSDKTGIKMAAFSGQSAEPVIISASSYERARYVLMIFCCYTRQKLACEYSRLSFAPATTCENGLTKERLEL